jgi:uncharacterized protein (TIGR02001 family)
MIKQSTLVLAALAAGVSAQAQEASALAVTLDVTYVSDYVFRGAKLGDASIQPSLEASYGDFYAGAWHTSELSHNDGATETDLYAGYGFAVTDVVTLDAGVTRYTYNGGSQGDTTEIYVGAAADVLLNPSVYAYYDFDLTAATVEVSIGHSLPIDAINASLDLSAAAGYSTRNAADASDYTYYVVGAAIPFKLSETATLTAGVDYVYNDDTEAVSGFSNDDANESGIVVGSVGLSIGF